MSIKEKYGIPDQITTEVARDIFKNVLLKFKNHEVELNELSIVAGILGALPEPNITITREDPDLAKALDAAMEIDYYFDKGEDDPMYLKFKNILESYLGN